MSKETELYQEKANYFISISGFIRELVDSIQDIEQQLLYSDPELTNFRIFHKISDIVIPQFEVKNPKKQKKLQNKLTIHHLFSLFSLSILEQTSQNLKLDYEFYRNLNIMKYNEIFMSHFLEKKLLEESFHCPQPDKVLFQLEKYQGKKYFDLLITETYAFYEELIDSYHSEDLKDLDNLYLMQYMLCKMKSCLILFPQKLIDEHQKELEQKIKKRINHQNILRMIETTFYEAREDIKKYRK